MFNLKNYKRDEKVDEGQCLLNLVEWIGDGSGDLKQEMNMDEKLYTNHKGTIFFMKTWTNDCQMISYGEITQELEILKQPNPHVV